MRKYVTFQKPNYGKGFDWRLMPISNETANQLLNGKFETFNDLDSFNRKNRTTNNEVYLLYKKNLIKIR